VTREKVLKLNKNGERGRVAGKLKNGKKVRRVPPSGEKIRTRENVEDLHAVARRSGKKKKRDA